jgi:LysM repeat protein
MGAKFVAAIIGVIILVVLAQTFVFGGDDGGPTATNPSSIPTATAVVSQDQPVLLGEGDAGSGDSGGGGSSSSSQSTYTVQSGDTLGAIAANLGVPAEEQANWVAEVLDLNGMADARQLQAGQELILPGVPSSSSSASEEPTAEPTEAPQTQPTAPPSATGTLPTPTPGASVDGGGSPGVYVVQDGDYPYLIALKYCVDDPDAWVQELLDINNVDASSLSIGQQLDLPPGTPPFCGDEGTGGDNSSDDSGT